MSAARDLDMLRAVLGEEQLDYLGYSYGAYLGTVYAGTYPDKVGRLVLDGAIDPSLSEPQITLAQAQGLETALRSYLAACIPAATCPFQGSPDEAMARVRAILDAVSKNPIPSTDGRSVGADTLLIAIAAPLYDAETWPALDTLFTTVLAGQAEFALTLVDAYYGRSPDGTYTGNLFEALRAVRCLDYPAQNNVAVMKEQGRALTDAAPHLGPYLAYSDLSCLSWPFPLGARARPHHRTRSGPDPGPRHHERPLDAVPVGRLGRVATRERHPRHPAGRRAHRVQPGERLRRRHGRAVPDRRGGARPPTSCAEPAGASLTGWRGRSRIEKARPSRGIQVSHGRAD